MMSEPLECVIFDCDGTLVDSEALAYEALEYTLLQMNLWNEATQACVHEALGKDFGTLLKDLERTCGVLPKSFEAALDAQYQHRARAHLKAIKGVHETLQAWPFKRLPKVCIASNGDQNWVLQALQVTGLNVFFPKERVFTYEQVARPKPAADLFLYAAERMGVAPSRCWVVEDSVIGVQAAQAAQIPVLAFLGASHQSPQRRQQLLARQPNAHLERFSDLLRLVHGALDLVHASPA